MGAIKKLYDKLKFQRFTTLVYLFDIDTQPVPDIFLRDQIKFTIDESKKETVLFCAVVDGQQVNRNFVYHRNLLARQLGYKGTPVIGGCSTKEQFRGKNIYPFMLTQILRWFKQNKLSNSVLIFVDPTNIASIKGIEKAGFKLVQHTAVYRMLGQCIFKKSL